MARALATIAVLILVGCSNSTVAPNTPQVPRQSASSAKVSENVCKGLRVRPLKATIEIRGQVSLEAFREYVGVSSCVKMPVDATWTVGVRAALR